MKRIRKVYLLAAAASGLLGLMTALAIGTITRAWIPSLLLGLVVAAIVGGTWLYLLRMGARIGKLKGSAASTMRKPAPRRVTPTAAAARVDEGASDGMATHRSVFPVPQEQAEAWAALRQGTKEQPSLAWVSGDSHQGHHHPYSHEIPVVMIADDFTYESFEPEFDLHRLTPSNWKEVMREVKPKLFICESAWRGGAGNPWQAKIYASINYTGENRKDLKEILAYCEQQGIPTVFWCKEDPVYFTHRVSDFVRTAVLFDYIFTSAEECVELYYKHARAAHADVLPFAVQPQLFNPIGSEHAADAASFAGTWYSQYPRRGAAARNIMNLVLKSGRELIIHDRMSESPDERYRYPKEFQQFVRPAITYAETADAYRGGRFGITLNTITDSRTMFARRAFEVAACGAVVLSNTARGVKEFFGDSVIYADNEPERFLELDDAGFHDLRRRGADVAMRHTYRHRAEAILSTVGIPFSSWTAPPDLVTKVRDRSEYERSLWLFQANRARLGRLAVLVADDAPGGLAMELMRDQQQGVAAGDLEEFRSGRSRMRGILQARQSFILDPSSDELPDLELLAAHTQYQPLPVVGAPRGQEFTRVQHSPNGLLVDADAVLTILTSESHVEVYQA